MLYEPVGFRAVHGLQGRFLLGQRRVKLVVAAALLLRAFDEGAQPVGGLQQALSSAVSSSPEMNGDSSSLNSSGRRPVMQRTLSVSNAL